MGEAGAARSAHGPVRRRWRRRRVRWEAAAWPVNCSRLVALETAPHVQRKSPLRRRKSGAGAGLHPGRRVPRRKASAPSDMRPPIGPARSPVRVGYCLDCRDYSFIDSRSESPSGPHAASRPCKLHTRRPQPRELRTWRSFLLSASAHRTIRRLAPTEACCGYCGEWATGSLADLRGQEWAAPFGAVAGVAAGAAGAAGVGAAGACALVV